jgi:hypothetical protein
VLLPPPKAINRSVKQFCSVISAETPVYVPVEPAPEAIASYCFDNVEAWSRKHGGRTVYGWAIWHWPGVYFEAEHHGIWESPQRELVDVTLGAPGAKQILFLPDRSAVFDTSAFRSNVRRAAEDNSLAVEFVSTAEAWSSVVDSYRRPGVTISQFTVQDRIRITVLQRRMRVLYDQLLVTYPPPAN